MNGKEKIRSSHKKKKCFYTFYRRVLLKNN